MDIGHFTTSTSELLHPELMSDQRLRAILEERGAELGEEVGHWQLRNLYDELVLPKPKRELDPNRRTTQRLQELLEASAASANSPTSVENGHPEWRHKLKRSGTGIIEPPPTTKMKMSVVNGECDMSHIINVNVNVSTNLSSKMKRSTKEMRSNDPLGESEEPPPKRRRSPIRFP